MPVMMVNLLKYLDALQLATMTTAGAGGATTPSTRCAGRVSDDHSEQKTL